MVLSYIRASLRSLTRRRGESFISVAGLAVGLICCMLIFVWVQGELSYDQFNANADILYRVEPRPDLQTPAAVAAFLKENYPEVENSARVHPRRWQITYGNESRNERIHCVDPAFLDMFSFQFVQGDPRTALSTPGTIVISESMATRIFGDENSFGKIIQIEKRQELTVAGVFKDVPFNSHLQFDGLVNVGFLNVIFSWFPQLDSWTDGDMWTYIQTTPDADVSLLHGKIQRFVDENVPGAQIYLQPITDIHLHGDRGGSPMAVYVYVFIGAAILILLSACINYVNLSTARAGDRAREVGIRKTVGAARAHLIWQFIGETLIIAIVAAAIAVAATEVMLPYFSEMVGRQMTFDLFGNPTLFLGLAGIILLTGAIAGIYPALVLSSFRPVRVLRDSAANRTGKSTFRCVLVVGQFTVSIFLLLGAAVVYSQLDYMRSADLGYDKESIVHFSLQSDIYQKIQPIFSDLDQNTAIMSYTYSNTLLDRSETSTDRIGWEGQLDGQKVRFRVLAAGYEFLDVFDISMAAGRYFSPDFATEIEQAYVLNETAVTAIGMDEPLGKRFTCQDREGTIVGVVEDFNYQSLHHGIRPLVIAMRPGWADNLIFRLQPDNVIATVADIERVIKTHVPDYPLEIRFLDADLERLYGVEERISKVVVVAAMLAVFMSCLGILGLVSHAVRRRTREIGIRKTLGATVTSLARLMLVEFLLGVGLACLIAWPIGYYACSRWLESFAFAIPVSWAFYLFSGLATLAIAVATAGFHAVRAARANPVDALRYE